MNYIWDEKKASNNFLKLGIRFEEAQVIWADLNALEFIDPFSPTEENRFIRVRLNPDRGIILVVYCERNDGETIRIISARKTTTSERADYEEELRFKVT